MISISCDRVSLSYGIQPVLENITFSLLEGDKLGIVGVNGAGKSTLFKIINNEISDYTGNVYISKGKTIGHLAQNADYSSDKTVLQAVLDVFSQLTETEKELDRLRAAAENGDEKASLSFLSLQERFIENGGLEYRGRCRATLISLGFGEEYFGLPITNLSGGQKTRVALAALLLSDPDIIMLDEPTNHLDIESVEWLEKYLAASKKTIITVSHDRYFLCSVTNKTLEIENHRAKLYNGNYDRYIEEKKRDREILEHQYKNQQKEIARIEAYIEQQRRWNRERNIIAAESRQKQLDKIERISAPQAPLKSVRMSFDKNGESGNDVLSVRSLAKSYGAKKIFGGLSFELKKHDRMIIIGSNGCGKSTLLIILNGTVTQDSGVFDFGYNVSVGYYDQENQKLHEEKTVIDEIWDSYPDKDQKLIRSALASFLFTGDDIFKPISVLSGGEKARVTFTKLMLSEFNLLFLDEPTNHLDIISREALEDALIEYDGTVVAVSHDRYFIRKLATRIYVFDSGGNNLDYMGNYDEYTLFNERQKAQQTKNGTAYSAECGASESKLERERMKKKLADIRRNEKKVAQAKEDIENTEIRLSDIEKEAEKCATDHVALTALYEEKNALEEKLLSLMEFLEEQGVSY